jgi:Xaa-Pro aminopeptidase
MVLNKRLSSLSTLVSNLEADILIITNEKDLFYLTGMNLSAGALFATHNKQTLYVDGRYFESCAKNTPVETKLMKEHPLINFLEDNNFNDSMSFAFDSLSTNYKEFQKISTLLKKNNPSHSLVPLSSPTKYLRIIKSPEEQKVIAESCELACKGVDFVCSILNEGITEIEVARELEIFFLKNGADKLAFSPIIAFGNNSSKPHYTPGNVPLEKNQPILMDFGTNVNHYCSDMTRVVFYGDASDKMQEIYNIVLEAQLKSIQCLKPGVSTKEVDEQARSHIESAGYKEAFMHSIGHGIGLEVHEDPFFSTRSKSELLLEEGMVITIEPGIYLPEIGGVRIEDTVLITKNGCRVLTESSSKKLCQLEFS